jgi:hypothetical protein
MDRPLLDLSDPAVRRLRRELIWGQDLVQLIKRDEALAVLSG